MTPAQRSFNAVGVIAGVIIQPKINWQSEPSQKLIMGKHKLTLLKYYPAVEKIFKI